MTTITRRQMLTMGAFVVAGARWPGAAQQATTHGAQAGARFRAGVDAVRLSVTARDARGRIVHDLRPEEFRLSEDDAEQAVAHLAHHESPISVVVLFDRSSSMLGEKLMHAKDAVVNFVEALRAQDEALVIAFSSGIDQLGQFGLAAKTIARGINDIESEGGTRLYDAVAEGASAIAMPDRKEKRAILILSDGEDTTSRARLDDAVEAVRRAEVPVYAIGIEMEGAPPSFAAPGEARARANAGASRPSAGPSLWRRLHGFGPVEALETLTGGSGGWTYPIVAAKRCKEVCLLVADELRNQYLLAYYPTNETHDGRWRTVTVRTTRPGVTLSTRAGYYAPRS